MASKASTGVSEECIFCKIERGDEPNTQIIYQDADTVVFSDHRPAATNHLLICPRQHIESAKDLDHTHIPMVEKLIAVGKQVLVDQRGNTDDVRMGFHWPPFHLVHHLHLHVISPQTSMSWKSRMIFKMNSYWFVSDEWVLERLRSLKPKDQGTAID